MYWTTLVDDNHISANNISSIEVLPIPISVTIGNVTITPGENVTIPINVTSNDKPISGTIEVIMPDNTTVKATIVNGTGTITWHVPEDYTPEKYGNTIRFPGESEYLPSNETIIIVKIPTHISVGNITTYPGVNIVIPINVTADNGLPFNDDVIITLPDGTNQTVKIVDGKGNVTWFVPEDYTPDKYNDTVKYSGNEEYLPSSGIGTVTVIKIPVDIIVGNVTARPGDDVVIPIKVIPRDGSVFNGNVSVELPDGTIKVVEIINGEGSVDWTVPEDYDGDYDVKVSFNGSVIYYPANGVGIITVIPDDSTPGEPVEPVEPVEPAEPEEPVEPAEPVAKKTAPKQVDIKTDDKATGNPILALLMVLALLGVNTKRRK